MNVNEQRISERAHKLWDAAGRPDGRSDEFWFAAKAELEREEGTEEANLSARVPPHVEPARDELRADRGKRESNSRL
ncbi:MAG: DUF2934 domain-containing protein [Stellaceae bacterium]